MAYMRGENYIFGSRDHMEFYIGDARKGEMQSLILPYDVCDQFVVMRYHDIPWLKRQRIKLKANHNHGRPFPPLGPSTKLTRKLWANFEWYILRRRDDD